MKFYGDIDLNNNKLQQVVIGNEFSFPVSANVGTLVFKDKRLYMCVALNIADPIWIPISNTINAYIHEQQSVGVSWTVNHNLNTLYSVVQVYDDSHKLIIPDLITIVDANTITVNFASNTSGTAVVLFGDTVPTNGIGIIA